MRAFRGCIAALPFIAIALFIVASLWRLGEEREKNKRDAEFAKRYWQSFPDQKKLAEQLRQVQ